MSLVIWSGYAIAFLAGVVIGVPIGKRVAVWAREEFDTTDRSGSA